MQVLKKFFDHLMKSWIQRPPSAVDALWMSLLVIVITINPYYAQGKINLFELGLYLPGIQAVLDGHVPYRDFFYLRGPFELYMPALAMKFFGEHLNVLYVYFYAGNVLCLVLCVWILKSFLNTRLLLYLAVPAIVARTYPRVVYMIWGGMRYAWGLLAVLWVVKFFKTKRAIWMFWAGITTAMGIFTSVEIGIYVILGVFVSLGVALILKTLESSVIFRASLLYALGIAVVVIPFTGYLISQQALMPYVESTLSVVFNMQKTFDPHLVSIYPHNLKDALVAMTNFDHVNFKHMTPSYLYLIVFGLVAWRAWKKRFTATDLALVFLGVYGFIMYNTGFRGIWASQFEMALMPEKIIYFFIVEIVLLTLIAGGESRPWKKTAAYTFVTILIISSIGYAIQRYNHRFMAFKMMRDTIAGKGISHLQPLAREDSKVLTFQRAHGIETTAEQADELEAIVDFLQKHTDSTDVVFTYPELGIYNFFADRPYLGRFPIATFSWMNSKWHPELVTQIKSGKFKYLILQKKMPKDWYQVYLGLEANRKKHEEVMNLIESDFVLKAETPLSFIYEPKSL